MKSASYFCNFGFLLINFLIINIFPGTVTTQNARRRECAVFDGGINMCSYESHNEMLGKLKTLESRHPNLAKIGVIGNSVQGR